jgi:hypothetical protein
MALGLPPRGNLIDGKLRGIRRVADIHIAQIMVQYIQAIGRGFAQRIVLKVMVVDRVRLLTPTLPRIFEIADQFLFLGIDTDDRLTRR